MHAGELLPRGKVRPVFGNAGNVEQAFFQQLVSGVEQALFPFGMGGRYGPVKGRKKHDPQPLHSLQGGGRL